MPEVLLYPITPWSKTDLYVDLVLTVAADFAARDLRFPNSKAPVFPTGKRSIDDHGIRMSGVPMKAAGTYTVGRQVVEFPIGLVPSVQAAAWLLAGLCQNKAYATTKYTIVTPTAKQAKWFSALISGSDEASSELGLWKALGVLPKSVKIGIPASGPDGGEVTMSADVIGSLFSQVTIPVPGSAGTLDAGVPILSSDCSFTMDAAAMKACSANINVETGVGPDPNINTVAAGPDAMILGEFKITGDLTLIVEPDTTSKYYAITNGLAAKTAHPLIINVGASIIATLNVIFEYPGPPSEQNGVYVQTFPWKALYGSVTDPKFEITIADVLTTWS